MKLLKDLIKPIYQFAYKLNLVPISLLEEPDIFSGKPSAELSNLKNKFKGERCFIVGNGPSLNKCDLNLLNDEFSFAVNGIFYKTKEMGYKPTFYVVEDTHVMADNVNEINQYHTDYRFFPTRYRKFISDHTDTYYFKLNRGFYEPHSENFQNPRFSKDATERLYCGQSVTIINLQLAYYLGFSEVYLIGMDFSYAIPDSAKVDGLDIESTEDDVNHFHPDYFGKGKKWHDPQLDNVLKSYIHCKEIYEADGRSIYNATIGGKLEVFDRVDYEGLFNLE